MDPAVKLLLDSVIVIDFLRALPPAVAFVESCYAGAAISVITRAEVLTGVDADKLADVSAFLHCFPLLTIGAAAADSAASLRAQHRWKLPDAFQAALALEHGLMLATRNTRDFPPERFPFVAVPYVIPAG